MRRGSLTERYQKCGKKSCPCHVDQDARHGPYYSLTRAVEGKTRTVHLRADEAEVVRGQVEAGRMFRQELEDYWQACERCADGELAALHSDSEVAVEKGGSGRRSKRDSKRKSRSS
jgi:hypothetical protein